MICRFIGKTSMGFVTGRIYTIRSDIKDIYVGGKIFGESISCICVYDMNSSAWCPYQSLESVLKNWEYINGCRIPT